MLMQRASRLSGSTVLFTLLVLTPWLIDAKGVAGSFVPFADSVDAVAPAKPPCAVTPYATEGVDDSFTTTWYGSNDLWAGLDSTHDGVWYASPGFVKVLWRRPAGDPLSVTGQRLDAPAPPLEATLPAGYRDDFQSSGLTFPTDGCWEVSAAIPNQQLRFVVRVHPGQDNPANNPSPLDENAITRLRERPLTLPKIASRGECQPSSQHAIERIAGSVLGDGPVYVQGLSSDGAFHPRLSPTTENAAARVPVRWLAAPDYTGPLLIRGARLDGSGPLRFGATDPQDDLAIPGADRSFDWRVWGAQQPILADAPGCYAVQVDGTDFGQTIVFAIDFTGIPDTGQVP